MDGCGGSGPGSDKRKNNSTSTSGKKTYNLSAVKVKKETMFEPGEHKAALMFDNGIVALVSDFVEYLPTCSFGSGTLELPK